MMTISFFKRWLLHSLLIWAFFSIVGISFYFFRSAFVPMDNIPPNQIWTRLLALNLDQGMFVLIPVLLLPVEMNYEWLYRRQFYKFAAGCLFTGIFGGAFLFYFRSPSHVSFLYFFIQPAVSMAAYAFVYPYLLDVVQKRILRSQFLYEETRAELQAIKSQLNPHFFFNTLNGLYAMALNENAEQTSKGIEHLSGMMRYVLEGHQNQFIPLSKEIEFIRQYVYLQKMRLPRGISEEINLDVEVEDLSVKVPHLLFIPLIENAFKYGISHKRKPSIQLKFISGNSYLAFHIENKVVHQNPGMDTGIKNLKRRLTLLYAKNHTLTIAEEEGFYRVDLKIGIGEKNNSYSPAHVSRY